MSTIPREVAIHQEPDGTQRSDQETSQSASSEWYHSGIRERIRRLEMSAVVEFGPEDEALKEMVVTPCRTCTKKTGRWDFYRYQASSGYRVERATTSAKE